MPPTSTRPIELRAAAPGTGHKRERKVVPPRWPRKSSRSAAGRVIAASCTASSLPLPDSWSCVGELDDEGCRSWPPRPTSVTSPNLRIDVHRGRPAIRPVRKVRIGHLQRGEDDARRTSRAATEPARMTSGSRNELNCTASARKISTTASRNAGRNLLPSWRSCRDSPV